MEGILILYGDFMDLDWTGLDLGIGLGLVINNFF